MNKEVKLLWKFKKKLWGGLVGGGGGIRGGRVGGVRVEVNRELKFLWKLKKKLGGGGQVGGWCQGGCDGELKFL